jgi:hypothetical protein
MSKVKPIYFRLLVFSFLILSLVLVGKMDFAQAGNLVDVSVTLTNSRLSYLGQADGDFGSETRIDITDTIGWVDGSDQDTDPIKIGDTLSFATTGDVTVQEIIDGNTIRLDSAVNASEAFTMTEKTDMSAVFTTVSNVTGDNTDWSAGYFRVLVPAASSGNADGDPDSGYFDYDTDSVSVTCENTTGSNHDFSSGLTEGSAAGATVGGNDYHVYRCNYSGGATGETITINISDIINPAPKSGHTAGTADIYSVIVQHMDGDGTTGDFSDDITVDSTTVKVGTIEAVKVSAEVVPSLTFSITGDSSGETRCGQTTDVTTTSDSVPFGTLDTGSFRHAAQRLAVTTNAVDGATVQAEANDQLALNGMAEAGDADGVACTGDSYNSDADAYTCIWDANVTDMDHETAQDWGTIDDTNHGFGYSLEDANANTNPAFEYNDSGTFYAKHFADASFPQDPQTLFDSNSQPTNLDDIYVCYRIVPDSLTSAGDYYNYITYIATAQF